MNDKNITVNVNPASEQINISFAQAIHKGQVDWDQSDSGASDYIKNKPPETTAGDGISVDDGVVSIDTDSDTWGTKQDALTFSGGLVNNNNTVSIDSQSTIMKSKQDALTFSGGLVNRDNTVSINTSSSTWNTKQDRLVADNGIKITGNKISADADSIVKSGDGISVNNGEVSIDVLSATNGQILYATNKTVDGVSKLGVKWDNPPTGNYNDLTNHPYINGVEVKGNLTTSSLNIPTYDIMTGATSSSSGTSGLVPAPSASSSEKFLSGDGTWKNVSMHDTTYTAGDNISISGTNNKISVSSADSSDGSFLKSNGSGGTEWSNDIVRSVNGSSGDINIYPKPGKGNGSLYFNNQIIQSNATGEYSELHGAGTSSNGRFAEAHGWLTVADGDCSVAFGYKNSSPGYYSSAFGYESKSDGWISEAHGYKTEASNNGSESHGYETKATGFTSESHGSNTVASGNYSVVFGGGSTSSGSNSVAAGLNATAEGNYSLAAGNDSKALGISSVALGNSTTASGSSSFSTGNSTIASGSSSVAMGYASKAEGNYSTSIGRSNHASNYGSTAIGDCSTASGNGSVSIGEWCKSTEENSISIGDHAESNIAGGVALGRYARTNTYTNESGQEIESVLVVGNGSSNTGYSNALEVYADGTIRMSEDYTPSNNSDVATKKYVDEHSSVTTWDSLTGKPSSFPPSSHTHTKSQITDFPTTLPNTYNLKIKQGSSTTQYNGSEEKEITLVAESDVKNYCSALNSYIRSGLNSEIISFDIGEFMYHHDIDGRSPYQPLSWYRSTVSDVSDAEDGDYGVLSSYIAEIGWNMDEDSFGMVSFIDSGDLIYTETDDSGEYVQKTVHINAGDVVHYISAYGVTITDPDEFAGQAIVTIIRSGANFSDLYNKIEDLERRLATIETNYSTAQASATSMGYTSLQTMASDVSGATDLIGEVTE